MRYLKVKLFIFAVVAMIFSSPKISMADYQALKGCNPEIEKAIDRHEDQWSEKIQQDYLGEFSPGKTNMSEIKNIFGKPSKDLPWTLKGTNTKVRELWYSCTEPGFHTTKYFIIFIFPRNSQTLAGYMFGERGNSGIPRARKNSMTNQEIDKEATAITSGK